MFSDRKTSSIDRDDSRVDVILHLRLVQTQLLQFLDLEQLAERDQQAVLPNLPIVQNDFARTRKRVRIRRLAGRIEMAFEVCRSPCRVPRPLR